MDEKTVLLVEPSYFVSRLIQQWLDDYRVIWASDLSQAEAALNSQSIDGVMTGLEMPDSSGPSTFFYLKQLAPMLPVMVMRGSKDRRNTQKHLDSEAAAVMDRERISEKTVRSVFGTVFGEPELIA